MLPPSKLPVHQLLKKSAGFWPFGLAGFLMLISGCGPSADSQTTPKTEAKPSAVDVEVAREGKLEQSREYAGTTTPYREVSVRSRVEGQVSDITVDVGSPVKQGQVLARLEDHGLEKEVAEANAEVAARQAEVVSLKAEVDEARALVQRARLELNQARTNAARLKFLYEQGAISAQEAEISRTTALTAEQGLKSAEQQVSNRLAAVNAAQKRVAAQNAIVARASQRRSYTTLTSPVNGSVLLRGAEPGDLAQPGNEILKLGDLSQVKVVVGVSELELGGIRLRQGARVKLDAFPERSFSGRVTEISPSAQPTARLIPIEVTIPNADRAIRAGLLARVSFERPTESQIIIPESALKTSRSEAAQNNKQATVFVVRRQGEKATVEERRIQLGNRADGRVEVISGIEPGESIVTRGGNRLKDGALVRISFLSEKE